MSEHRSTVIVPCRMSMRWGQLPDPVCVSLLKDLTSVEIKPLRLVSPEVKQAVDRGLLCLRPRQLSLEQVGQK